eukprot:gene5862-11185_t
MEFSSSSRNGSVIENDGPNYEVKFGKTLLENWVEERQCAGIDKEPKNIKTRRRSPAMPIEVKFPYIGNHCNAEMSLCTTANPNPELPQQSLFLGILTKEFDSTVSTLSTCKDSYREPQKNNVRQKGKRLEMLERHLYQQISNEVKQEFNPPPPKVDYTSTTKKDFSKDFQPIEQPPTMHHDVNSDQPLTFWNHNLNSIHGVSQIQTNDTPFKKNTAFSTPIDEYKDAPKPGEGWHY